MPERNNVLVAPAETLNFIKSMLKEPKGPSHRWVNMNQNGQPINQDGIFLVLVNAYFGDSTWISSRERTIMFEKVKLLQHRFPKLNIFALQCGNSVKSSAALALIFRTVMEEYVTFPILISDKNFQKETNGPCCLLFEGSTDRLLHQEQGLELESIVKVIEELDIPQKVDIDLFHNSRQYEVIKEPCASSSIRNLLVYFPGCVSADEDGDRLFISDCNHHRIVITDGNGRILDSIGSSPGFEDGEFESAKLLRPAAFFYDSTEDCLYIVDSENHAVRRADLERRTLDTMLPVSVSKTSGMWSWILDKLGLAREVDVKPEEINLDLFSSPWHLLKLGDEELVIINRSLEVSWIVSMKTWQIVKVTRGIQNIVEIYGHMIEEKTKVLMNTSETSLLHRFSSSLSVEELSVANLMSSAASFHGDTIFCDAVGHRVIKYHKESGTASDLQFSNMRLFGLPYWMVSPLETFF